MADPRDLQLGVPGVGLGYPGFELPVPEEEATPPPPPPPPPAPASPGLTGAPPRAFSPGPPPVAPIGGTMQGRAPEPPPLRPGELPPPPRLPAALTPSLPHDDHHEYTRATAEELSNYRILRRASGEFEEVDTKPIFREDQHKDYHKLVEMQRLMSEPGFTKRHDQRWGPKVRQLQDRIERDTKARNAEANRANETRRRDDLKLLDGTRERALEASNTLQLIDGGVKSEFNKQITKWKSTKPEDSLAGDYMLTATPLATMNAGTREQPDYAPLNAAARRILILNGITPQEAAQAALQIGTPMGIDTNVKPNVPQVGFNGYRGRGGKNYKIVGRDDNHHAIIELPNHQRLRIDTATLRQLEAARLKGYEASQKWHQIDQDKRNAPPDLIQRTLRQGADWIGQGADWIGRQVQ